MAGSSCSIGQAVSCLSKPQKDCIKKDSFKPVIRITGDSKNCGEAHSACFTGSLKDWSANIDAGYRTGCEYDETSFNGYFGNDDLSSNYVVSKKNKGGYSVLGSHAGKDVFINVSENCNGKLENFQGTAGNRFYELNYSHYGDTTRSLLGKFYKDNNFCDKVALNISHNDYQLVINGKVGKQTVYLYLKYDRSNLCGLAPDEFKRQLEIGAVQMLLFPE